MKYLPPLFLASVLVSSAFAQSQPSPGLTPPAALLDSELITLAHGYVKAFNQLINPPFTLAFQKEGVLRMLDDVRHVREAEGVLLVEARGNVVFVINPRDIVYISESGQLVAN